MKDCCAFPTQLNLQLLFTKTKKKQHRSFSNSTKSDSNYIDENREMKENQLKPPGSVV